MPPRKKPIEQPTQDEYLAGIMGHNSELSDDALIAENFKLEDMIKQAQARFDELAKPHKERIKEIEDALFARLSQRGADSTKTESGTAYISNLASVKIESSESLFDFAAENWESMGPEIKLSIGIKAVREWMDNHEGQLPPGISLSKYSRLNIKRS